MSREERRRLSTYEASPEYEHVLDGFLLGGLFVIGLELPFLIELVRALF